VLQAESTERISREEELRISLAALSSLSQKMVAAARAGEWDAVIELETQRSPQLTRLSASLPAVDEVRAVNDLWRQTILAIIESDKEVAILAEALKVQIAQGVNDLSGSRKALNAYLDIEDNLSP
jgi:flagellar protein FliT